MVVSPHGSQAHQVHIPPPDHMAMYNQMQAEIQHLQAQLYQTQEKERKMELLLCEKGHIDPECDDIPLPNQAGTYGGPINPQIEHRINWNDQRKATPLMTEEDVKDIVIRQMRLMG
jgi:hypothetical protein